MSTFRGSPGNEIPKTDTISTDPQLYTKGFLLL